MANNTFAPFGFRPSRLTSGSLPNYALAQPKPILYTNSNKMYAGDPVQITTSGYVDTLAPGSSTYYGIFQSVEYVDSVLGPQKLPSWQAPATAVSGSVYAQIITDRDQLWEVQVGGSTSVGLTFASVEMNVQFAYGTGNTRSGISGAYIDLGTAPANTNTLPFRFTNLWLGVGNDNTGLYNIVEVRFNNFLCNTTTGRS